MFPASIQLIPNKIDKSQVLNEIIWLPVLNPLWSWLAQLPTANTAGTIYGP